MTQVQCMSVNLHNPFQPMANGHCCIIRLQIGAHNETEQNNKIDLQQATKSKICSKKQKLQLFHVVLTQASLKIRL